MTEHLERGRASYERSAWSQAYRELSLADEESALAAEDLERMATAAYLLGDEPEHQRALERAYRLHVEAGEPTRAARCGFWLGLTLLLRGVPAQASGWLSRARRLVEGRDCVEHGYLLLPVAEGQLADGEGAEAHSSAAAAAKIGERMKDPDLVACARHLQGRARILQGRVDDGLSLLDETMLAAVEGELSPIVTGLVYCSVIDTCRSVFALDRAGEWTAALTRWCESQPEMIAFTGTCLLHRAEILQLQGAWQEAMTEASRACDRAALGEHGKPPAAALYRRGEIHRLRGELAEAESAYRKASRAGSEPQPGWALLRLAQGRKEAATNSIRRALAATPEPLRRARLLPASVEILLSAGRAREARQAFDELQEISRLADSDVLRAHTSRALGSLELDAGRAREALAPLREAFEGFQRVDAPYEAACVRVLVAEACAALGDEETVELELEAAREVARELGAAPLLERIEYRLGQPTARDRLGLTPRELEVLRLVATGETNRAIAKRLSLSERTIDRHVSNILTKLDVPSRTAATAVAYDHGLL